MSLFYLNKKETQIKTIILLSINKQKSIKILNNRIFKKKTFFYLFHHNKLYAVTSLNNV